RPGRRARYSARSVIAGSTRAARRAGAQLAIAATPPSRSATLAYVVGSRRETPNSIVSRSLLATPAPTSPSAVPTAASASAPPTMPDDASRRRAERDADADLAGALAHRAGDDAVEPDRCQQERGQRKGFDDREREAPLRFGGNDQLLHRRDPLDRPRL